MASSGGICGVVMTSSCEQLSAVGGREEARQRESVTTFIYGLPTGPWMEALFMVDLHHGWRSRAAAEIYRCL